MLKWYQYRYLPVGKSCRHDPLQLECHSIYMKKSEKSFLLKKMKKIFLFSVVSDHVVTLNCFTVRAHFFNFPSIFFEGYHHHYTPMRCCAQRFWPHVPPPIFYSGEANITKWRNSMQVHKTFFLMEWVRKS